MFVLRAAESAMKCLKKFSTGCLAEQEGLFQSMRMLVINVVGNNCPKLTLGLFCPYRYNSLINDFTCSYDDAVECLPEPEDLGGLKRMNLHYCK